MFMRPQRQLEVYHLKPNETYDFQIWANNHIGPGVIANVSGTTKSQYEEKGKQPQVTHDPPLGTYRGN